MRGHCHLEVDLQAWMKWSNYLSINSLLHGQQLSCCLGVPLADPAEHSSHFPPKAEKANCLWTPHDTWQPKTKLTKHSGDADGVGWPCPSECPGFPSAEVEPGHPSARKEEMCLLIVNMSLNPGPCFYGWSCKNSHRPCWDDSHSSPCY